MNELIRRTVIVALSLAILLTAAVGPAVASPEAQDGDTVSANWYGAGGPGPGDVLGMARDIAKQTACYVNDAVGMDSPC